MRMCVWGAQWRIVEQRGHRNVGHLSHKNSDGQPFHLMFSLKDSVWMWRVVFYNEETNLRPGHLALSLCLSLGLYCIFLLLSNRFFCFVFITYLTNISISDQAKNI